MSQSKIYAGNLSYDIGEQELEEFFTQYGDIQETKLISDRETGRSKGFAFITFNSTQAAQAALESNGTELKGRAIRVNIAKEGGGRSNGGRGGHGQRRGQSAWQGGGDDRRY